MIVQLEIFASKMNKKFLMLPFKILRILKAIEEEEIHPKKKWFWMGYNEPNPKTGVHSWTVIVNIYVVSNVKELVPGKLIPLFCVVHVWDWHHFALNEYLH